MPFSTLRRTPAVLLLCAALLAFVGCDEDKPAAPVPDGLGQMDTPDPMLPQSSVLSITSPANGDLLTDSTVEVEGKAEGITSVSILDQTVPVSGGLWKATVTLSEGSHALIAKADNGEQSGITVTVDTEGPQLVITSPQRGTFLVAGREDMIIVEGRATDAGSGIDKITIDGNPINVDEGGFFKTSVVPALGANTLEIEAFDGTGRASKALAGAIYGDFAPFGQPTDNAVAVRATDTLFPVLENALLGLLEGGLVDQLLEANAPSTERLRILGVEYGEVEIALVPQDGFLFAEARIHDLRIDVEVNQDAVLGTITLTGAVTADPVEIAGRIYLEPSQSGSISAELSNVVINLNNFDLSVDGILDVLAWAVEDLVRGYAERTLTDILGGVVLDELFDPSLLHQDITLLGRSIPFDLLLTELSVDTGGITVAGDADLSVRPSPTAPEAPGVYITRGAPPSGEPSRMVRVGMADDLFNKIMFQAWRGGLFDINVRELIGDGGSLPIELNAGALALLVGAELREHAESDTPVDVVLRPMLPPVIKVQKTGDRILNAHLTDLLIDLYLAPESGPRIKWATLAIAMEFDVGIRLMDGSLSLDFDVRAKADLDDEPLFDIDDNQIETIIQGLFGSLPRILGQGGLDNLFDLGEIDVLGIQMSQISVEAGGPDGDYLIFNTDLSAR